MNQEVKILFKKGLVFLIPVFIWILLVYFIDPFNYFNKVSIVSEKSKEKMIKDEITEL